MVDANKSDDRLFRMVAIAFAVAGTTLFAMLLALYFWQFHGALADKQETWGQFGDFLGGTLNPLLGFGSVVLLALTLREQRRFLVAAQQQHALDGLRNVVDRRCEELDDMLDEAIETDKLLAEVLAEHSVDARGVSAATDAVWRIAREDTLLDSQISRLGRDPQIRAAYRGLIKLEHAAGLFVAAGGSQEEVVAKTLPFWNTLAVTYVVDVCHVESFFTTFGCQYILDEANAVRELIFARSPYYSDKHGRDAREALSNLLR